MRNDNQRPPQGSQPPQPYPGQPYNQGPKPPSGSLPPNPNDPYRPPQDSSRQDQMNNPNQQFPEDIYYPDLTMDMGSSLGYGQSLQYHAISVAQPSQALPKLRQSRLQQLREERMRRGQRRLTSDATTGMRPRGQSAALPENKLVLPPSIAQPGLPARPVEPLAAPPQSPLSGGPEQQVRSDALILRPSAPLQPAAQPAQDTTMLQRVRVARNTSIISAALMVSSILGLLQTFLFT